MATLGFSFSILDMRLLTHPTNFSIKQHIFFPIHFDDVLSW